MPDPNTTTESATTVNILEAALSGQLPDTITAPSASGVAESVIAKLEAASDPSTVLPVVEEVAPVILATEEPTIPIEVDKGTQFRLRANDPTKEALFQILRENPAMSAEQALEAARAATGQTSPAVQAATESDAAALLASKEARFHEIAALLEAEVEAAGDVGVTLTKDVLALQREQMQLAREIPRLESQVDHSIATEDASFNDADSAWRAHTLSLPQFADANVDGSPLQLAIQDEVSAAQRNNDPILNAPDRALLLASRAANRIGHVQSTAQPAQVQPVATAKPAQQQAPQAMPRAFAPASGAANTDAHRIHVASQELSPVEKFNAGFKTGSVAAGLEMILTGGGLAPANARF